MEPGPRQRRREVKAGGRTFPGTCVESSPGKTGGATSEATAPRSGYTKITWFLGDVCTPRLPSHCQRCRLHLLGALCNAATAMRLLNVASLRAMGPGERKKQREVHKSPKLGAKTWVNAQSRSLIEEERVPGGPGKTTEPPVAPRTECH